MKKENVIKSISTFFDNLEWKYAYNEEECIFCSGVNMGNIIGNIKILIIIRDYHYKVIASLNSRVELEHMNEVAEYLHRVNYGMNNGNFELDYHDGDVRYKTFITFRGIELSKRIIEDSIAIPLLMFDKYGKSLMKLMLGEGVPAELVAAAENSEDE